MPLTPAVGVAARRVRRRSPSLLAVAGLALVAVLAWLTTGVNSTSAAVNSLRLRATYDVSARINWSAGTFVVSSVATVSNPTKDRVNQIAFNLITLRTGAAQLTEVTVAGTPVQASAGGQTVIVPLPNGLAPGDQVKVRIDYRATFNGGDAKRDLFIQRNGIAAGYRWIPWLTREQRFRTQNFGETWVTDISPRVTVRLSSDAALKWATSGRSLGSSDGVTTFEANDVRDFNFSASPNYRVRKLSLNGINVRIYYRTLSPDALERHTLAAIRDFSSRVGPYPYGRLAVSEVPAGTGMESPALAWISSTVGGSRLRHIVVHEVAHQWFYSQVGTNPATNPFVDEALSDFLTRNLLGTFRGSECATAPLDRPVYDYSARCYPEVIYVQGANYLRAYREDVGAKPFWSGLSGFYRDRALQIVGTRALLDALDAATGFNSQRHAERFPSLYE